MSQIGFDAWWFRLEHCVKDDRGAKVEAMAILAALLKMKGLPLPELTIHKNEHEHEPTQEQKDEHERIRMEIREGWDDATRDQRIVDGEFDGLERFVNLVNLDERRKVQNKRKKNKQRQKKRAERIQQQGCDRGTD